MRDWPHYLRRWRRQRDPLLILELHLLGVRLGSPEGPGKGSVTHLGVGLDRVQIADH